MYAFTKRQTSFLNSYLLWSSIILGLCYNTHYVHAQDDNQDTLEPAPPISYKYTSVNLNERHLYLIYHHTAASMASSLEVLLGNSTREVSSHFLINDVPDELFPDYIYGLVPEDKRAWHAGLSNWKVDGSLNSSSIGIEIVNQDGNHYHYPDAQVEQFIALGKYIISKYKILETRILAHSDIAPTRKDDPGILFPWKRLYDNGIGMWPDDDIVKKYLNDGTQVPAVKVYQTALRKLGYEIPTNGIINNETIMVIRAFQRHFRQGLVNGIMDKHTYATLVALNEKYK